MSLIALNALVGSQWLKYGFIGLVVLVNLLFFFLFRRMLKDSRERIVWVIVLIGISIFLLIKWYSVLFA